MPPANGFQTCGSRATLESGAKDCGARPFQKPGYTISPRRTRFAAGVKHRLENFHVARAAAQISRKAFADLGFGGVRAAFEKLHGG